MSKLSVVTSQGSPRQGNDSFSVSISQDIAQRLSSVALSRQIEVGALVNEILEHYFSSQPISRQEQGAASFYYCLWVCTIIGAKSYSV